MNLAGAAAGIGLLVVAPILGVTLLSATGPGEVASAAPICAATGPVPGLDAEQAANARIVVAVTDQVVAPRSAGAVERAAVIALMAAWQESRLHDLANPAVTGSTGQPGASGVGTNLDSVGLFQQRAPWGSVAQRMDPAWATRAFVARLLAVPGWTSLPPGAAAQAVQRSAFPTAYAPWQADARSWLDAIDTRSVGAARPASRCGAAGVTATGTSAIPPGFTLPPETSPAAARAVSFALAQLGEPYVFDAAGPDAYDCSGLTMTAWATAGIRLPHNAAAQAQLGTPVADPSLLRPGDLVFIPGSDGTMTSPGHVGMFLGNGLVIEAPQTGEDVKIVPLNSFGPVAAMRRYA